MARPLPLHDVAQSLIGQLACTPTVAVFLKKPVLDGCGGLGRRHSGKHENTREPRRDASRRSIGKSWGSLRKASLGGLCLVRKAHLGFRSYMEHP